MLLPCTLYLTSQVSSQCCRVLYFESYSTLVKMIEHYWETVLLVRSRATLSWGDKGLETQIEDGYDSTPRESIVKKKRKQFPNRSLCQNEPRARSGKQHMQQLIFLLRGGHQVDECCPAVSQLGAADLLHFNILHVRTSCDLWSDRGDDAVG